MTRHTSLWTMDELTALLRLRRETGNRMAVAGKVPGYKIGGRWRFDPDEIDAWMAQHKNGGIPEGNGDHSPRRASARFLPATEGATTARFCGRARRREVMATNYAETDPALDAIVREAEARDQAE
jgi:excisionase family DNA binding protein